MYTTTDASGRQPLALSPDHRLTYCKDVRYSSSTTEPVAEELTETNWIIHSGYLSNPLNCPLSTLCTSQHDKLLTCWPRRTFDDSGNHIISLSLRCTNDMPEGLIWLMLDILVGTEDDPSLFFQGLPLIRQPLGRHHLHCACP